MLLIVLDQVEYDQSGAIVSPFASWQQQSPYVDAGSACVGAEKHEGKALVHAEPGTGTARFGPFLCQSQVSGQTSTGCS